MCQTDACGSYDCQYCKKVIHVSFGGHTMYEEWNLLREAGWSIVPATGTLIVCPDCLQPWMSERIARGR